MTDAEERLSGNNTPALRIHRAVAGPIRRLRCCCLRHMHTKGILQAGDSARTCAETDPTRWVRK